MIKSCLERLVLGVSISVLSMADLGAPTNSLVNVCNAYNVYNYTIPVKPKIFTPRMYDSIASEKYDSVHIDSIYALVNKNIKSRYTDLIDDHVIRFVVLKESDFNPFAHNKSGARGLTQLMPDAWKTVDTSKYFPNVYDAKQNLQNGIRLLEFMQLYCSQNVPGWDSLCKVEQLDYVLMTYNYGPQKMEDIHWNKDSIPKETKNYIREAHWRLYHQKNFLAPMMISDSSVLKTDSVR